MPRPRSYDFVAWKDEGLWTVHSPSIPGVYGLGETLAKAKEDFAEAASDMLDYLAEIGEPPPRPTPLRIGEVTI